jgi:hypothetical protein
MGKRVRRPKIQVVLDERLDAALRARAVRERRSVSQMAALLLEAALKMG